MNRNSQVQMTVPFTPVVKALVIANLAIWIVCQVILEGYFHIPFTAFLGLFPSEFLFHFFLWQPVTYMFLHSLQWTHIVFNMLLLWWLGAELEGHWGKKNFFLYYLGCGVGAGIIYCLGIWIYSAVTGSVQEMIIPVIGASGAIFGLMVAYGILFGDRVVYFMMLFPMKSRYFVMILGGIELVSLLTSGISGGEVAYLAHLGGIAAGFIYLRIWALLQRYNWQKASKRRGRNLRLVVNNDKVENEKGPKYWN